MKIAIVGTGRLANALAQRIAETGGELVGIWGRNLPKSRSIAYLVGTKGYELGKDKPTVEVDLTLVAVTDSAIEQVGPMLKDWNSKGIAHTAGSMPLGALGLPHEKVGVFYPYMTFAGGNIPWYSVPMFIQGGSEQVTKMLRTLGKKIAGQVSEIEPEKRAWLHLAGIIANNFTTYLGLEAGKILESQGIHKNFLLPLLTQTLSNLTTGKDTLTGPARRGNIEVVNNHLTRISNSDSTRHLTKVYQALSEVIMSEYASKGDSSDAS